MPYRFAAARTAVVGENQKKIKRKKKEAESEERRDEATRLK